MDVPGRQGGPSTATFVLMFDACGASWSRRQGRMDAAAGLDAGLFVGGEHEIVGAQRLVFPETLVEIQDGAGFLEEARVARKDPGAMTPRTERILTETTPDGGAADLGDQ